MTTKNPFATPQGKVSPDDNMRVIWFGDGRLRHAHSLWKNLSTIHHDIWSWRTWEPDVVWYFHMGMKGWCKSTREEGGKNTFIEAMLIKADGTTDVPKDIELYNALLGE